MDNLGTWAVLSIPVFVALTSSLKGRAKDIAAWVYTWGLGAVWSVIFWQGYYLALEMQRVSFVPYVPETQAHYLLTHWLDIAGVALLMALPPVFYFYSKHKSQTLHVG